MSHLGMRLNLLIVMYSIAFSSSSCYAEEKDIEL